VAIVAINIGGEVAIDLNGSQINGSQLDNDRSITTASII
jgi:hypothetical protein